MALIKCPVCKKKISDSVEACPQCGYKIKEEDRQAKTVSAKPWYKKWWAIALVAVAVFFILIMIFAPTNNSTSGDTEYNKGIDAFINEDYEAAFKAFKAAHSLGNPEAKGSIGLTMFVTGNPDEGFRLIEEAADNGYSAALIMLAFFYFEGFHGITPNWQEGYSLMEKAYDTGHWAPAVTLALYYTTVPPKEPYYPLDFDKALFYAKEAVARGADGENARLVEIVESLREDERKKEAATIDVIDIVAEFNQNKLSAERKFSKGKGIYISGYVDAVGRDKAGQIYVALICRSTSAWSIQNIKFVFEEREAEVLASLSRGQRVRIFGITDEQYESLLFVKKCKIDRIY